MKHVCNGGRFDTDITRDFTVKIDADGLEPDRTYFYQFEMRGVVFAGRSHPHAAAAACRAVPRIAFASCSNYPYGYFNAYARIAERDDVDVVLHLGDYLVRIPAGAATRIPRSPACATSCLRTRLSRSPTIDCVTRCTSRIRDLQEAHRQHPFICVWDDHESANDAYRDGAENHNPEHGEGEWAVRRRQAIRAYNEYMPIRNASRFDDEIYRRFRIGNLADLIMLDTRLHGRDLQAAFKTGQSAVPVNDPVIADSSRTLLGFDQERWLERQLWTSKQRGASWRVLGQQVMMAQLSSDLRQHDHQSRSMGWLPAGAFAAVRASCRQQHSRQRRAHRRHPFVLVCGPDGCILGTLPFTMPRPARACSVSSSSHRL